MLLNIVDAYRFSDNTIGNELFVDQYDKSSENIINNDIYIDTNESKDLSI